MEHLTHLWQEVQQHIPPGIQERLHIVAPLLQDPRVQWIAGAVLVPLALLAANNTLSNWALNWSSSRKWDPSRELVLVTGGSSGIGKNVVLDLVEYNLPIVILDVQEPTYELRM